MNTDKRRFIEHRKPVFIRVHLWLILILCILLTACSSYKNTAKEDLEAFNRESEAAVTAELVEDWGTAAVHYEEALKIAEKMKWSVGIAGAKQKLGDMYGKKSNILAEKFYTEAKDECKPNPLCDPIDPFYDKLVLFYIYQAHDPKKAEDVMDEMVREKKRLRDGGALKDKFRGYAGDMQIAGFEKEALILSEFIKQMPD